ncbi:MAG TPA: hypothetical protein DCX49_02210 [Flavobacteriales bacterium]|nr:hypothetical protein [Flavobacteriales bacterium]
MKKVFFAFLAVGALASCSNDMTCTCTIDGVEEVTECIDCTGETADAFETACEASDLIAQLVGGSCTLD